MTIPARQRDTVSRENRLVDLLQKYIATLSTSDQTLARADLASMGIEIDNYAKAGAASLEALRSGLGYVQSQYGAGEGEYVPQVKLTIESFVADFAAALAELNTAIEEARAINQFSIELILERTDPSTSTWFYMKEAVAGDTTLSLAGFENVFISSYDTLRVACMEMKLHLSKNIRRLVITDAYVGAYEIEPVEDDGTVSTWAYPLTLDLIGGALYERGTAAPFTATRLPVGAVYSRRAQLFAPLLGYPLESSALTYNTLYMFDELSWVLGSTPQNGLIKLLDGYDTEVTIRRPYMQGSSANAALFTVAPGEIGFFRMLYVYDHIYPRGGLRPRYVLFASVDGATYNINEALFADTPDVYNRSLDDQVNGWFPLDSTKAPLAHYGRCTLRNIAIQTADWSYLNDSIYVDVTESFVLDNVRLHKDGDTNPMFSMHSDCTVHLTNCHFDGAMAWPIIEENGGTPTVNVLVNSSFMGTGFTEWLKGQGVTANGAVGRNIENGAVV